ncbi:hypothetical protein JIG36_13845 [Actinoplanes sp. LDG1-06]|uniref:YcaO domain-containing protein n=1 Tax=Paractinoplanes ovalisporus TaxID=2810368 RepID=A0ABS2AB81_9ACTN|nr:hypothetical protein [Actinoplanes ovalisporus]MBM2616643.1 hypothetical protein [Actinoplanes ovalisporus]
MTTYETVSATQGDLPAEQAFCAESLSRTLLDGVSGAPGDWAGRVPLLGRHGQMPSERRNFELAQEAYAEAVPHEAAAGLDVEAIAEWIVGHYPASLYPSVLLGSPHGAAAHLAVALGAAWLPTSIPVTITWPGGSAGNWPGALAFGAGLAASINDRNPDVTVRQVHDPMADGPLCGATVKLHLRWHKLPAAYEKFLRTRIAPGGGTLLLRDLRAWPVVSVTRRYAFQVGSPVSGVKPEAYRADNWEFRHMLDELGALTWVAPDPATPPRYAERSGEPALGVELNRLGRTSHRVLYSRPDMLSACVADLLRQWRPRDGNRCVVECGRLLDPWQARAGGLIPYWCESASSAAVEAAEWWLAGCAPFDRVTVLPGPPGYDGDRVASLGQWRSLASCGRERVPVDRVAASRYPTLPMATRHATRVLAEAGERPEPPTMTMPYALSRLQLSGSPLGLLVS